MNSTNRSCTVRINQDLMGEHVAAFRTALETFGDAVLADFLPSREHPNYLDILLKLVCLELAQTHKASKPTSLKPYQERYPELFAEPTFKYKLALEEFYLGQETPACPATSDIPSNSLSKTRRADNNATPRKIPSEPEIALKANEVVMSMPEVGDEFRGFKLMAELGKGAFGKVFLARQGELAGRQVALKIAGDLFIESQTLAQLQHTHIVPIYSFHPGQPFQAVCMPYLGSTTLAHVLDDIRRQKCLPSSGKELLSTLNDRRKKSFGHGEEPYGSTANEKVSNGSTPTHDHKCGAQPDMPTEKLAAPSPLLELEGLSYLDAVLWLAVRLADGLAHAHQRGVLHRDLKPANVLLTDDGLPMLLDFNLAQNTRFRDSAAGASIGGTLPYMAPEHLESFRGPSVTVDARSDVYSFGVILFELLSGVAPFPVYRKLPMKEVVDRMIQDRRKPLPRLRSLNKNVPPAVEAMVHCCLASDPGQRYQTASELEEDLQRQLDHRPLKHAPNPSWWERAQKFHRRHPRLVLASVTAIALSVLLAMTTVFVIRDRERAGLDARAKLLRFEEDAQTAYFFLHSRTAKRQLAEGERACRTSLAHFQVLENTDWLESSAASRLPEKDRRQLQEEVGQLLILHAHAQQLAGEQENQSAERQQELFKTGLQFCSLAESCFPAAKPPRALWKQRGELHDALRDRENALACFERAKQADSKTAQDLYLTACLLAQKEQFREALVLLRQAMRLRPQDYNLHFLQGICHDYLSQHAEAVASYHTCIALRPKFFAAYHNRGLSYLRQNNYDAACKDFDEVVQLYSGFADAYLSRGLALQGLKKYTEASADLTEAIERGHEQTRVYFLRSQVREKAGDIVGAKSDFAEGLRREPSDEFSWVARGIAFVSTDAKQALHDFERALKLNSRSLPALQNKAHMLAKYFKRTEEAVQTLDTALQLYPENACLRAGRGVYLARLGKRASALKDAEQALLLDGSAANFYHVAGIYALTSTQEPNDRQEALRLLASALKKGFGFEYLEIDRDLDPLRSLPAFRQVVQAARALQNQLQTPLGMTKK